MCSLSTTSVMGLIISINYLIDSYYDLSGDAIVTIILVRNTMSFAISYGITPWIINLGYQNCFISAAFMGLAACSAVFVVIKFGKALRARSAPSPRLNGQQGEKSKDELKGLDSYGRVKFQLQEEEEVLMEV
ncbi:hypothetical protein FSARC_12025 [Fusarium sarcochroum]|uniref:Uncharacterized protein n=1 Tax=Fusarium sarcochroum TaxID=1208366 RepID=A0A8H4TB81_9HYPO|nr:hypothetical protein FSARC_12025 [Fusarium sarcochroum]